MTREEVYKLIDGERDYQNGKRWDIRKYKDGIEDKDKSVAEWVIYLRHLVGDAEDKIYHLDKTGALEMVRKIAAVAVACMEHNETQSR